MHERILQTKRNHALVKKIYKISTAIGKDDLELAWRRMAAFSSMCCFGVLSSMGAPLLRRT